MACTAEANGTTITCACSGCGIGYDHGSGKYLIFCCGTMTEMGVKNQTPDPNNPPNPHDIVVDFAGITLFQAAQILDKMVPDKIKITGSFKQLSKKITLKAALPLEKLAKKLGIELND